MVLISSNIKNVKKLSKKRKSNSIIFSTTESGGPSKDRTVLMPTCIFRKDGLLGIVIMSGDVNSTMDDHIYYDNKLNLKKAGANTFFFQNHIVYAYINNERHVVTIELKPRLKS